MTESRALYLHATYEKRQRERDLVNDLDVKMPDPMKGYDENAHVSQQVRDGDIAVGRSYISTMAIWYTLVPDVCERSTYRKADYLTHSAVEDYDSSEDINRIAVRLC